MFKLGRKFTKDDMETDDLGITSQGTHFLAKDYSASNGTRMRMRWKSMSSNDGL